MAGTVWLGFMFNTDLPRDQPRDQPRHNHVIKGDVLSV